MPRLDKKRDPIHKKKREDAIRCQMPLGEKAEGLFKKYKEINTRLNEELAKDEQDKDRIERQREILNNIEHALASMHVDVKKLLKSR